MSETVKRPATLAWCVVAVLASYLVVPFLFPSQLPWLTYAPMVVAGVIALFTQAAFSFIEHQFTASSPMTIVKYVIVLSVLISAEYITVRYPYLITHLIA